MKRVVAKHREAHIPLDMVYMDIDYMDHFKDFTVNPEEFPDFPGFVSRMKEQGVRLVPIIDAGVKEEAGYSVCDEGKEKGYFCKRADGTDFEGNRLAGVEPLSRRAEPRGPGLVRQPVQGSDRLRHRGLLERHERARHLLLPGGAGRAAGSSAGSP